MQISYDYVDDNGDEQQLVIPAVYEVCSRCDGKGRHVNPSIDGNGITMEEWESEWSPEEQEGYFRGDYDVQCDECHGERVVLEPDRDRLTADQAALLQDIEDDRYAAARERASELRYGY